MMQTLWAMQNFTPEPEKNEDGVKARSQTRPGEPFDE
jgi:hypothetical protein